MTFDALRQFQDGYQCIEASYRTRMCVRASRSRTEIIIQHHTNAKYPYSADSYLFLHTSIIWYHLLLPRPPTALAHNLCSLYSTALGVPKNLSFLVSFN